MTMVATRAWLSEIGNRVGNGLKRSKKNTHHAQPSTLGILAFETARTMSRLVSLYKSLSDDELLTLKKEVVRYEGVAYLNSNDEPFLLNLACAERLEELNQAATVVARLGKKCSDPALNGFEDVYADLKFEFIDLVKLDFASKEVEKMIHKMEKLISATSVLYSGLEALAQLEVSERKLNQWRNNGTMQTQKANFDLFDEKLALQRQQVRHYREVSLWKRTFSKTVGLMARTVCIVYARICAVFGPYISAPPRHGLFQYQPPLQNRDWPERNIFCTKSGPISKTPKPVNDVFCTKSGPISKTSKPSLIRFSSGDDGFHIGIKKNHFYLFGGVGKKEKVLQAAPAGTLGDSGLALRYANVIILAERYLNSPCLIGDDARENLYQMLPTSLKMLVRSKLKNIWRKEGELGARGDESLAEGWREAATVILGWLAPMAHDTVRWQEERNFERQHFDARPTVLLLQTLHFSDREKTEAAIAEVLVGLSCICRYENRCFSSI